MRRGWEGGTDGTVFLVSGDVVELGVGGSYAPYFPESGGGGEEEAGDVGERVEVALLEEAEDYERKGKVKIGEDRGVENGRKSESRHGEVCNKKLKMGRFVGQLPRYIL